MKRSSWTLRWILHSVIRVLIETPRGDLAGRRGEGDM